MKIFISWSKQIGLEIAIQTKKLLEFLDSNIKAFVSETDISSGDIVHEKIISEIKECDKLIICFTRNTKKSPWLLYEAGFAHGSGKTVIPFLFDTDKNWSSWIDNPMNIARELRFQNHDFIRNFISTFDLKNTESIQNKIENYCEEIKKIQEKYRVIDPCCEDIVNKLNTNKKFQIENPRYENGCVYFATGFESFELYRILTESFQNTGKYFWIYGRKNMKLFSDSYKDFFEYLQEKAYDEKTNMDGIDFRCLFLNPDSPEVTYAHRNQRIFKSELQNTIVRALDTTANCKNLRNCLRMYSNKRKEVIIRIDNCILYTSPSFDAEGYPQLMTDTRFEVFSAFSEKGKRCIERFENIWDSAIPLTNFEEK